MSKNIEDLFKEKFEQFEAPVSDGLWDKIQENPNWKKHLHRQKVTNLTVFSILAICVIGVCTLLIHKHIHQEPEFVEAIIEEEEVLTNDTPEPTATVTNIAESETSETISATPIEKQADPTQKNSIPATETAPALPFNTSFPNSENVDLQNNTAVPNPTTNTSNTVVTPTKTPAVQENKSVKSDDDAHSEPTSTPSNPENNNPNTSLFSIPNAFTPNGDGLNDIFKPVTAASIQQYQMDIFMVNGQHVFSSKSIDYGWNGEYQGSIMNGGSYIYVIKYKDAEGKEHIDKGQLLLIR